MGMPVFLRRSSGTIEDPRFRSVQHAWDIMIGPLLRDLLSEACCKTIRMQASHLEFPNSLEIRVKDHPLEARGTALSQPSTRPVTISSIRRCLHHGFVERRAPRRFPQRRANSRRSLAEVRSERDRSVDSIIEDYAAPGARQAALMS